MDTTNMIDITKADLSEVAKAAYDLSSPVGLGFLHYEEGSLTDDEADALVTDDPRIPLSLDYVKGRACKLTVFKDGEKCYIPDRWYDHTNEQLLTLLERVGVL